MEDARTIAEQLPKEIARVKTLVEQYKQAGPRPGVSLMLIEKSLARAEYALSSGDVVAMYNAYQELKGCA
jgi:molybdopterin converting factor small subunit